MRSISFIRFTILLALPFILIYGVYILINSSPFAQPQFNSGVIVMENGFGYTITCNEKTLIRQDNIPAIKDFKNFCSKNDASKVANLVIKKLEGNEPPTISMEELVKLRIHTYCPK